MEASSPEIMCNFFFHVCVKEKMMGEVKMMGGEKYTSLARIKGTR